MPTTIAALALRSLREYWLMPLVTTQPTSEVAATIYKGLGLDPHKDLPGPQNRPIPLADYSVKPITELF